MAHSGLLPAPTLCPVDVGSEGDTGNSTDYFSSMPVAVLYMIHGKLCLQHATALECTSKQLRTLLRESTRFKEVEAWYSDDDGCFWTWIAANGHRVDALIFQCDSVSDRSLGCLRAREGVSKVGTVTVHAEDLDSLEPLAGMSNLEHLLVASDNTLYSGDPPYSLQPLESLTALKTLDLGDLCAFDSPPGGVAALTSLTRLTSLAGSIGAIDSIQCLTCLGGSLQSLTLGGFAKLDTLQPIASMSNLTYLCLEWPLELAGDAVLGPLMRAGDALQPLSALHGLKQLELSRIWDCGVSDDDWPLYLDMRPLSNLASLESLALDHVNVYSLQPITALGATLRELKVWNSETMCAQDTDAISALSALRTLVLPDVGFHSFAFLLPLTNLHYLHLQRLERLWKELFALTSLTQLRMRSTPLGKLFCSLAPFGKPRSLQALHLDGCSDVGSAKPLCKLKALTELVLEFSGNKVRIKDLESLTVLAALKRLCLESRFGGDVGASQPRLMASLSALTRALPGLRVGSELNVADE
jgi:hypothetical protein